MKLYLPCNWDPKLIKSISSPVYILYGKLGIDEIGGGRPACKLSLPTKKFVRDYIKEVRAKGINFSYLLNASCLGNKEFTKDSYRRILKLLEWIQDTGANYITVAIPYLAELIKTKFPEFKISVSKMAFVSSVQQAKFWEDLGANEITLDPNITRNFKKLKQIKKAVKIDLILLANEACLFHCPYVYYHVNSDSHASQNGKNQSYICYSRLFCENTFISNPEQIIKSMFIRPEDLAVYEELGIRKFKLIGRDRPTTWILNTLKAYSQRKYEGNLAEILGTFSFHAALSEEDLYLLRLNDFDGIKALEKIRKSNLLRPKIYINNKNLEGFIDFFKKSNCEDIICSDCRHCREFTKRAVSINKTERVVVLKNLNRLMGWIKDGKFNT